MINNYHRAFRWLDTEDLEQEAAVTALETSRSWRPGGAPLDAYQARAVAYSLRRYTKRAASPVSASARYVGDLDCTRRESTDWMDQMSAEEFDLDRARAIDEVRSIFAGMDAGHLAVGVLLEERKPAEVARLEGVDVELVYRTTAQARRRIAEKKSLRQLVEAL